MNDSQIVERILRRRDTALFGVVVAKYSGLVFSKALGIIRDCDLAADVAQQTFINAWEKLDSWCGGESLAPWLSVIAAHLAVNMLEKNRRENRVPLETDIPEEDDYSEEREQMVSALREAVKSLPGKEREIVVMHYYRKLKTEEIARRLGMSTANVLVKLHRIREKLKNRINSVNYER